MPDPDDVPSVARRLAGYLADTGVVRRIETPAKPNRDRPADRPSIGDDAARLFAGEKLDDDPAHDAAQEQHKTVSSLGHNLINAADAIQQALRDLNDLRGPDLYAADYDGMTGYDIADHLGDAGRAVRAAQALHERAAAHYPNPEEKSAPLAGEIARLRDEIDQAEKRAYARALDTVRALAEDAQTKGSTVPPEKLLRALDGTAEDETTS